MDIHSLVVGGGPVASLVILRVHNRREGESTLQIPIRIGDYEASAISMGVTHHQPGGRPMTHDLLTSTISALGGRCASVCIVDVRDTTFFAKIDYVTARGEHVLVDARPSDAIALAVRADVPIYADDSVIEKAAFPDFRSVELDEEEHELEEFRAFVEDLSPEDFNTTSDDHVEE